MKLKTEVNTKAPNGDVHSVENLTPPFLHFDGFVLESTFTLVTCICNLRPKTPPGCARQCQFPFRCDPKLGMGLGVFSYSYLFELRVGGTSARR
jgi:hypothetical protein